jgi:hypothetical protein
VPEGIGADNPKKQNVKIDEYGVPEKPPEVYTRRRIAGNS